MMFKRPHEMPHESHIHIRNHWYEKPLFVGLCFALIVVVCVFIGELTSQSPQNASAVKTAALVAEPIRIAAVGDSNTEGTGVDTEDKGRLSYPAQLQALLGSLYNVHNYGVSGSTLISGTNNPYSDHRYFEMSKELKPDVVLIMLGTNDVRAENWNAKEYKKQLIDFINDYKNLSSPPIVYLLTPPEMFIDKDSSGKTLLEQKVIPEVYAAAEETSVEIIDVFSATKDYEDLFKDGVHPNAEGYGIIAQTVYKKLVE